MTHHGHHGGGTGTTVPAAVAVKRCTLVMKAPHTQ